MSPIHIQELAGCGISSSNEPREDMVRKMIVGWMKIRVMFCSMFLQKVQRKLRSGKIGRTPVQHIDWCENSSPEAVIKSDDKAINQAYTGD